MLNFKKGLALVLAAATAFTFAPVANLGVNAEAAAQTQIQTHDLIDDDFEPASGTVTYGDTSDNTRTAGFFQSFNSLSLALKVKVEKGHTYQVYGFNNVSDIYVSDVSTIVPAVSGISPNQKVTYTGLTKVNNQDKVTDTDGKEDLYFTFNLNSVNGGSFQLKDADQSSENSYSNITVKITNTKGINKSSTGKLAEILEKDSTGAFKEAPLTNGDATGTSYALSMNTSADPYYVGVQLGTITSWTGATGTSTKAVARTYSGGARWMNPDSNTGNLDSTITAKTDGVVYDSNDSKYDTAVTDNAKNHSAFVVQTAHSDLAQLYVSFYDADNNKIGQITFNYTVARSNHAIDWIKWGKDKYDTTMLTEATSTAASLIGWYKSGDDAYTLYQSVWNGTKAVDDAYPHQMNPYDKKTATITVKSESDNVTFVSTDTKIVDVKADANQPYVATVTAKSAGTATINVFVGSTNNNKGKVYILPVQVSENGNDVITPSDSAKILGNEEDDVINLDATDQTAAGAVKEDTVTFKSEGGLKFDKVSVGGDTSAVTVSQSDGVVTVKSNKTISQLSSPAAATIKMTSLTETGKNVMGSTKTITVVVWAKPAAQFTVDPIFLSLSDATQNTKILETNPNTFTNVSWSIVGQKLATTTLTDESTNVIALTNGTTSNTQTTAKVIAQAYGTATVKALVSETATTRKTGKKATVTVGASQPNKITVSSASSLTMTEGDTAQIDAKATTGTVKFESGNTAVASVTTGGAVTAVKAGATTIKISAEGADPVFVPVVVNAKPVVYADPAQVKGVKVSNKKGAKVTVKYTKDTTAPTMKYYVQKKVSGKKAGKSVGSTKTTLSVKKGATVKVRVKAYYYDANGVKHKGAWSSWKTLKTDKK